MRRLTILLAALGALLLVPAAQAFAHEKVTIEIFGTGSVKLKGGAGSFYAGSPKIECSYNGETETQSGTCEAELSESEPGKEGIYLAPTLVAGSGIAGWEVTGGKEKTYCSLSEPKQCLVVQTVGTVGGIHIVLYTGLLKSLTINNTGSGTGETKCRLVGLTSWGKCAASYTEGLGVEVKPIGTGGSLFGGWTGCDSIKDIEEEAKIFKICKVTMTEPRSVTATFNSPVKNLPLTVTKTGAGSGTVTSGPAGINCGGTCKAEFEESSKVELTASAEAGSEFREWSGACSGTGSCEVTMSEAKSVNAFFSIERPVLTLERSGNGSVSSKPKGIKCTSVCSLAKARFNKNTPVEIKTTEGVTWTTGAGTCTGSATVCSVAMSEAVKLVASFAPAKAIVNPQPLTLTKGGSNGQGTVKATGITCEAACTETTSSYFGGTEGPKAKPAAAVELKAAAAFGSTFSGWSNCPTPEGAVCKASMNEARTIAATFSLAPSKTLTLVKSGNGSVSSKPKGIKCASTCSKAVAAMPEGATVEIKTTEGITWTTGAGTCTGSATVCTVTLTANTELVAEFAPGKAIVNPQPLTLSKSGTGYGTVKATGLTCEALCTTTTASYFGGTEGPKAKAAAIVTLTATPQAGSQLTEWVGCPTPEGLVCKASMSEAHSIIAKFDE